jgi:glutamyl-tRNA reductase
MHVAIIGLSFRTAPLALREQLCRSLCQTFLDWRETNERYASIHEIACLATCNRLEFIAAVSDATYSRELLADVLSQQTGVPMPEFYPHLYHYTDEAAAVHLCRVAAGLDSLALGEAQILGQVSDSFMAGTRAKSIGPVLTELFRAAIRAGKRTRTETAIGHKATSMSGLAVNQAEKALGDLAAAHCVVVGLGEMGQLALKALRARGAEKIVLVNRTPSKAEGVPQAVGLPVYGWDGLVTAVAQADLVITATSAPEQILQQHQLYQIMRQRAERSLYLIDLCVPRNIEPSSRYLPGIKLWDVDQLQRELDNSLATRQQAIPHAEAIVAEESEAFMHTLRQLELRHLITDLRHKAESIRQQELTRALRLWSVAEKPNQTAQQLDQFSRALVNKLLHDPTRYLRHHAPTEEAARVRQLFGLRGE